MKVLAFANIVPLRVGAYELLIEEFSNQLQEKGDSLVVVLGGQPCESVQQHWKDRRVHWEVLSGWTNINGNEQKWRFPFSALRFLRQHRPDVVSVHFGNEIPSVVTVVLCWLMGMHCRWLWIQDQRICDPSWLTAHISGIRVVGRVFDRLVAVYEGGRRSMVMRQVPPEKTVVIHNAVADVGKGGGRRLSADGTDEMCTGQITLFSASSLIPRKRVDFLLHAFAHALRRTNIDMQLLIAGEGPERANLERMIRELDIAGKVIFMGQRQDVRQLMQGCDIYVHAAEAEACSYAVLEAMCAGKPVVMTDAGAAREQVEDGITGYILGYEDINGFVEKMTSLVQSASFREAMGAAARKRWHEMFRLDLCVSEYVKACSIDNASPMVKDK